MPDLTPDEIAFFATGELPEALQQQQTAGIEPVVAPVTEPVVAPTTPSAQPDQTDFFRQQVLLEQQRANAAATELAIIKQQLEARTNPPIPAPDAATDPLGAMMHQLQQVNATVQDLQNKLQTEQANNQLKSQFNEFTNSVRAIKDAFEKTTPDFNDAYNHVRTQRAADLRLTGVPEANINQVLLQDELNIAQNALQQGKNPAQEIYNMAKRYGYQAKAVPQNAQQKIEAILQGQAADKNPGKGAPSSDLTLDSLKDMSNSDLTKVVMNDKQWEALVGGKNHDIF